MEVEEDDAPALPPFDESTRMWAELFGLMDPVDPEEQRLMAPVVLENAVERVLSPPPSARRTRATVLGTGQVPGNFYG